MSYRLIQDPESLSDAVSAIAGEKLIAIDFEGEWNLHRYGMHLCLIQLFHRDESLLIDAVEIGDLSPVWRLLEDTAVKKIAHGPQSDLVLLDMLFRVHPKNLFDTQRAAMLLGYETTSLTALLERHLGIIKNEKVREMDWGTRPIPDKMLEYASKDVAHLHLLYELLERELKERERLSWVEEENRLLETVRFVPKTDPHLNLKGASKLWPKEKRVLYRLYEVREGMASELNKPPGHVISNQTLVDLAVRPPQSAAEWKEMRGVHPAVRRNADKWLEAIQLGRTEPGGEGSGGGREDVQDIPLYKLTSAQRKRYDEVREKLSRVRQMIEEKYEVHAQILSQKTIHKFALGFWPDNLRDWQWKVIRECGEELAMNPDEFLPETPRKP